MVLFQYWLAFGEPQIGRINSSSLSDDRESYGTGHISNYFEKGSMGRI